LELANQVQDGQFQTVEGKGAPRGYEEARVSSKN